MIRGGSLAIVASLVVASAAFAQTSGDERGAVMATNLDTLSRFYDADVSIFEGGGINNGWADDRDRHIGPELTGFDDLTFEHRHIVVHVFADAAAAYLTSEYTVKARVNGRDVDSAGLEALVLVKTGDAWRSRHSHTSARRRPPSGEE